MKNKRGRLALREVVMFVSALAGLMILFGAFYSFAGIGKDVKIKQAEKSLEEISFVIKELENGAKSEIDFFLQSPNGWKIISWPKKQEKPFICGDYCICICSDNDINKCNQEEVCIDTFIEVKDIVLELEGLTDFKAFLSENQIVIERVK